VNAAQAMKVPFDRGYYAEFTVKNFSEFWLKKEPFNRPAYVPLQLEYFTATKLTNNDVLLEWKTLNDGNAARFELEVAKGNTNYQQNNFVKFGEVAARQGATQPQVYSFIDVELNKTGVRYYRLKIVHLDGSISYSLVRPVYFTAEYSPKIYPNPSTGIFNYVFQEKEGQSIRIRIIDIAGRIIYKTETVATGFIDKLIITLQSPLIATGVYLLQAEGQKKEVFKIIKY